MSLRRALGISSFGVNQMLLEPGQRGRIHRHRDQEEAYLVITGRLTLVADDGEHELEAGDLIRVAPEVRRQLVNRHDRRCVVVALGGAGEHAGRDGVAFSAWDDPTERQPADVLLPDDLPAEQVRPSP